MEVTSASEAAHKNSVREGLALVNAMRVTASVFINDDSNLHLQRDYLRLINDERLGPGKFAHIVSMISADPLSSDE